MDILKDNNHMHKCIEACVNCMQACEECLTACYKEPDLDARVKCVSMLRDCADICVLAAQFMSRNSEHSKAICKMCADLCEMCAVDCETFKDDHCKNCAKVCRACAEECRKMAQ